ncbi:DMT family transporter [candidate division KSB1 bacterium]
MNKKGLIFALFTALVSGFSIFVNKFGLAGFDPYVFAGVKNIIVVIFLISAILLLKDYKELKNLTSTQWVKLFLIGLIGGSIPFLLFFKGLSMTSAAMGAFIHKTMFVFVAIGAVIFLREKIDRKYAIGAVLLLAGNFLLLKLKVFTFDTGALLIFLATLLWAVEQLISKHTLKEVSSRTVAFGRMFFGSLIIILFWGFTGRIETALSLTLPQLTWILLTAGFLFLYVISWYYALQRLKASIATSILLLGSPITTALSFVFLGTAITISQAFGMLLIVGGVIGIVLFDTKRFKYLFSDRSYS